MEPSRGGGGPTAGADPEKFAAGPASYDIPASVIGFLHGELGTPPGGWPEPFRSKAIEAGDLILALG